VAAGANPVAVATRMERRRRDSGDRHRRGLLGRAGEAESAGRPTGSSAGGDEGRSASMVFLGRQDKVEARYW